ncbi:hypothetical protein BXY66_1088 [Shimia isoporae]|uniref:Sulfotransferase family protein n=1 Tax=Shimia isoporae TaxID=647720 RepID=A0A4R1NL34_9RHOB|nr:hypothetical protein [Shimia isoporae]TCL09046.1 hypothetical protein BXY66_1088 [Shimia isoporae]
MKLVLHIGAHFTDENKLVKSLVKNAAKLAEHDVIVPEPRSYRRQIRDIMDNVDTYPIVPAHRDSLLRGMLGDRLPDRIVLSNSNFFGVPRGAVRENRIYPNAVERLRDFAKIFHAEDIEVFIAIRDPATFLPALVNGSTEKSLETVTGGSTPMALRWSELIMRIRQALPEVPVTVWCNEDTPLIWEEVLREFAGFDPNMPIDGGSDLLSSIMTPQGFGRYQSYVASHPDLTEMQKRRVIAAFLDKFAIEEEVEEELDLPGWSEDFVEAMSDAYDEDVFLIERIPGVTLITP